MRKYWSKVLSFSFPFFSSSSEIMPISDELSHFFADSASPPKPPQQQETTAIGSNSTDDVPASPKPSIESKDKGKDKLSTQTVVDGLSSRSRRIVINEGGLKEVKL